MANTAINHDPVATFPGSSTNTAVVQWSGTSGNALLDSGVIIDGSNNVTGLNNVTATGYLHLTGDEKELRFYEGANYIAIAAPSGLGADYTFTLPLNDGAADEFLQTNGSGVLVWAAAAGTTINSNADNRVITGSGTANTLQGESGLTFDGRLLSLIGDGGGYSAVYIHQTSTSSGRKAFLRLRTESSAGGAADPEISFETNGGTSWQVGIDNSQSDRFVIGNTGDIGYRDKLRFNTDAAGSDVTVVAGNLVIGTACKGIDFSNQADDATGETMTAELLDHYEEGTFTPSLRDGSGGSQAGYATQQGAYIRIGSLVTVWLEVRVNSTSGMTTGNPAVIDDLPFVSHNSSLINGGFFSQYGSTFNSSGEMYVTATPQDNDNYLHLRDWNASEGVSSALTVAEVSADGHLSLTGIYRAA